MAQLKHFASFHSEPGQAVSTRADLMPREVCHIPREWLHCGRNDR